MLVSILWQLVSCVGRQSPLRLFGHAELVIGFTSDLKVREDSCAGG